MLVYSSSPWVPAPLKKGGAPSQHCRSFPSAPGGAACLFRSCFLGILPWDFFTSFPRRISDQAQRCSPTENRVGAFPWLRTSWRGTSRFLSGGRFGYGEVCGAGQKVWFVVLRAGLRDKRRKRRLCAPWAWAVLGVGDTAACGEFPCRVGPGSSTLTASAQKLGWLAAPALRDASPQVSEACSRVSPACFHRVKNARGERRLSTSLYPETLAPAQRDLQGSCLFFRVSEAWRCNWSRTIQGTGVELVSLRKKAWGQASPGVADERLYLPSYGSGSGGGFEHTMDITWIRLLKTLHGRSQQDIVKQLSSH